MTNRMKLTALGEEFLRSKNLETLKTQASKLLLFKRIHEALGDCSDREEIRQWLAANTGDLLGEKRLSIIALRYVEYLKGNDTSAKPLPTETRSQQKTLSENVETKCIDGQAVKSWFYEIGLSKSDVIKMAYALEDGNGKRTRFLMELL